MTLSMVDPQVIMQPESSLPDSITCGQCSLKFYHVSSFLKHKSTCPGADDKLSSFTDKKCDNSAANSDNGKSDHLFPPEYIALYMITNLFVLLLDKICVSFDKLILV